MEQKSYAQGETDLWLIDNIFKDKTDGFFVDVGAHNGIRSSMTKLLEEIGWKGFCIEPNRELFKELVNNRKCKLFNVLISNKYNQCKFLTLNGEHTNVLSSIVDLCDPRHMERIEKECVEFNEKKNVEKRDCVSLDFIFKNEWIEHIDFLKVDTETTELDVLESINFKSVKIDYIMVECNYELDDINNFLVDKNYDLVDKFGYCDYLYRLVSK